MKKIRSKKTFNQRLKELVEYRELVYFFAWKDIKVKYKQAVLGFLWVIIQPILLMLVFTLFSKAVSIDTNGIPYPVFAFTGIIFWNIFASGVNASGNSIVMNANIIKKIFFPKLILPVSSIVVSLFDFTISFFVLIAMLFYFRVEIVFVNFFLFFPAVILIVITSLGVGLFLSALNVKYRDFKYIIPFFIQLLFFASPVIYPAISISNPFLSFIYNLNPMIASMEIVRTACFNMKLEIISIIPGIISSFIILIVGTIVFFKMEREFADIV